MVGHRTISIAAVNIFTVFALETLVSVVAIAEFCNMFHVMVASETIELRMIAVKLIAYSCLVMIEKKKAAKTLFPLRLFVWLHLPVSDEFRTVTAR